MSGPSSVRGLAAEQRVLGAIAETPRTIREIVVLLRTEVFESWAAEHGFEIEWGSEGRGPDEPVGARILAISTAAERGLVHLGEPEVRRRLYALERRGLVGRITPPGGRGILWHPIEEER